MPQTAAVKAKEYLSRDALSHIDMLEAIDKGSADILYAERGGVILIERESRSCMISVDEISICEELPSLGNYPQYAAHQRDVAAYITRGRSFPHSLTVCQAAYLEKEPPRALEARGAGRNCLSQLRGNGRSGVYQGTDLPRTDVGPL